MGFRLFPSDEADAGNGEHTKSSISSLYTLKLSTEGLKRSTIGGGRGALVGDILVPVKGGRTTPL